MSTNNPPPFFIVGSERSGTTLLMAMLGHHAKLAVPEVTWFYPRFRAFLHTYGDLSNPNHLRELAAEMVFGLKTPFFGLAWNPRTIVDEIIEAAPSPSFGAIVNAILSRYAEEQGKSRWGEKTPHHLYYVNEILEDFPNAKIINIRRDGRDVAVEQLRSAFGPRNIYCAATIWRKVEETAERLRRELSVSQWLDVRYETLVAQPAAVLQEVCHFLGEDFEPTMLDFHLGEIARRRGQTRDHRALGKPVSAQYVGLYRDHLSLYEQRIFAAVAGDTLARAGYGLDVESAPFTPEDVALWEELDQRIRAATLDAPEGHIVYESYNDWLADRREQRRQQGIWQGETPANAPDWAAEFLSGQRAPRYWKTRFAIARRYQGGQLVL